GFTQGRKGKRLSSQSELKRAQSFPHEENSNCKVRPCNLGIGCYNPLASPEASSQKVSRQGASKNFRVKAINIWRGARVKISCGKVVSQHASADVAGQSQNSSALR